jgi:hypothetical protein
MKSALKVVAVLFILFGGFAAYAAKSDITIIVAVLCFGFGSMLIALSAILSEITRSRLIPAAPSAMMPSIVMQDR